MQPATSLLDALRSYKAGSEAHPTPEDLLRLVLVVYLSSPAAFTKEEWNEIENELQSAGCDLKALQFVRR